MKIPAENLTVVTAPSEEPITLDEAKDHLRVVESAEDDLIEGFIAAARELAEEQAWRTFVTTVYDGFLEGWPKDGAIELARPPIQSVASVKYTDSDGVEQTFSAASWQLVAAGGFGRVMLRYGESWPTATLQTGLPIVVRYTAGYGAAAALPERVKSLLKLLVGALYEHREAVVMQSGAAVAEMPAVGWILSGLRAW